MGYEVSGDASKVKMTVAHATVFQGLASLLIPFVVIHNAVHASEKHLFRASASAFARAWGPSMVALVIIPFLPMVDEPVEAAVDYLFDHVMPHRRTSTKECEVVE